MKKSIIYNILLFIVLLNYKALGQRNDTIKYQLETSKYTVRIFIFVLDSEVIYNYKLNNNSKGTIYGSLSAYIDLGENRQKSIDFGICSGEERSVFLKRLSNGDSIQLNSKFKLDKKIDNLVILFDCIPIMNLLRKSKRQFLKNLKEYGDSEVYKIDNARYSYYVKDRFAISIPLRKRMIR